LDFQAFAYFGAKIWEDVNKCPVSKGAKKNSCSIYQKDLFVPFFEAMLKIALGGFAIGFLVEAGV
jgi:hypothetical protein